MLHNDPTETSALIKKDKKALSTILYDNVSYYTPIAGQLGLGAVGLGAGFLYAGPATTCAQARSCGLWLSNLTSEKVAVGVFFAGGLDYAGINAYFSSVSVKNFFIFESNQSSWLARLGWGSAIIFYTTSQSASTFLSSTTTNAKTWQTALTVAGAVPGNLYTAVGTAQYEIPMLLSYLLRKIRFVQESVTDICLTPSPEEMQARNQRAYYLKQQHHFLKTVDGHWSYIKSHPRQRLAQADDTPLSYLFSSPIADRRNRFLRHAAHKAGNALATGMTTAISVPFIINNYQTINNYVPNAAAGSLTAYFSYSFVYSNFKLCTNFVDGVLLILDHLVSGRPIDSLVFQLHPYISIGAFALVLAGSAMSYALMNTIYEMVFPQEGPTRDAFRYATNVSMVLYHIAGLYHLYELLVSTLSRNVQDQFLFKVEAEVERFHRMTAEEYRQYIETNTDEQNQQLGVTRFRQIPTTINEAERAEYQARRSSSALFSVSQTSLDLSRNSTEIPSDASPQLKLNNR